MQLPAADDEERQQHVVERVGAAVLGELCGRIVIGIAQRSERLHQLQKHLGPVRQGRSELDLTVGERADEVFAVKPARLQIFVEEYAVAAGDGGEPMGGALLEHAGRLRGQGDEPFAARALGW
jgi:hypothetical protein